MRLARDRRGTAALEFALIAPVLLVMMVGVVRYAGALILWEQAGAAAAAVVQAAARLSVASNPSATALTATQMQNAMSAIYAEIPLLNLGSGTSFLIGSYSVTLSSVVYLPLCATTSGCAAQTPYVLWSTQLSEGGSLLITSSTERQCGALVSVTTLSNDGSRLAQMLNPTTASGSTSMTLVPQLVADVHINFETSAYQFWATAALPAPINGTEQEVTFTSTAPTGNVLTCTLPTS
jgi:Flp pilus assembly pilin Flp